MLDTSKRSASHAGRLELELLEFFRCCCNRLWNRKQTSSPASARCCHRSYTNASRDFANACNITNDDTNGCSITNDPTSPSGLADYRA